MTILLSVILRRVVEAQPTCAVFFQGIAIIQIRDPTLTPATIFIAINILQGYILNNFNLPNLLVASPYSAHATMTPVALVSFLILLTLYAAQAPTSRMAAPFTPVVGPRRIHISRYFFIPRTNVPHHAILSSVLFMSILWCKCQLFFWSGCQGVVPFRTLKRCEVCCQIPSTSP